MPHRGETEAERQHQRGAFEERRVQRVEALKQELIRDNLLDPREIEHVPYYRTIEEQNQFIDSITHGQTFARSDFNWWEDLDSISLFGQTIRLKQDQFNKAGMIPLILPKFADLTSISVKEQLFLAMQGLGVGRDRKGRLALGGGGGSKANFQKIIDSGGHLGAYYQRGGAGYQEVVKQKKPESVFQPAITEPAVVTVTESLLPEISILPAAHAQPEPVEVWPTLSQETKTIINNIPTKIKAPNWFVNNNINWLLQGKISEAEFLRGYYDYVKKGTIILIDKPEPIIDQVSTNMIRQELLNFTIANNRIQGSIKFTATDAFNPYYYNKPITTYLQLKSADLPNWTQISTTNPKSNRLTFTETQRDEVITFDEDAQNLIFVSAESFIDPAMSEVFAFTIEAGKEPTIAGKPGLMGAGVLGVIGILMLGGFIVDHVRKRK